MSHLSLFVSFLLIWISLVWLYRTLRMLAILKAAPIISPYLLSVTRSPLVSVIIPCKNEEKNVESCLKHLMEQTYKNFEVIVVNDNSTDSTESILKRLGVQFINAEKTPEGWTGKNFAIHSAIPHAKGDWFLFTDADTRHTPSSLASALHYAQSRSLEFLTLLPKNLSGSFVEDLIQPFTMALIGLWFPMDRINNPNSKVYFGNGQYILMSRSLYEKIGGHHRVRGEFLEDFALMNLAKENKAKSECAIGSEIYGTRMYDSLNGIWKGWRRIYLHAFKKNTGVLAAKSVSIILFSILPFIFPFLETPAGFLSILKWILPLYITTICWKGYGVVKAKRSFALLHPFAGIFLSLILLDAAFIAWTKQKTVWR